ncbi:MAG TPA: NosD domain-containing protein [Gemmatimonadota bacterium]|nr:NosD domain-containing protein [Gemmatimonadota bacterium]
MRGLKLALPFSAILVLTAAAAAQDLEVVVLEPGMTVDRSVRVRPGVYRLAAPADSGAAITIRGDSILVDFSAAVLVGAPDGAPPDSFVGVGIRVEGGSGVTVRGAVARGYKVGLLARSTRGLRLENNDFSHNWRQRLASGIERESLVDWQSYHQNDADEWLRYGAGIYLSGIEGGEIVGNTVVQGQNGLMITRSSGLRIWNNTLSWLSGIGIGLYRSSGNTIMHNAVDFAIRGYSHGFYNRGQDSAAILLYEQSQRNVVAYNSATHSGDGLFVWAGQSTMDTGEGGVNDNLFYGNDFSYASNNAIEATFSRNVFAANRAEESDYGLWGGYSWGSRIVGNEFAGNRTAIAIEHGQDNEIAHNSFRDDTTAVRLWWNEIEPSDWGYPQHRDTASRDYRIRDNAFSGHRVAFRIDDTRGIELEGNAVRDVDTLSVLSGDTDSLSITTDGSPRVGPDAVADLAPAPIAGGVDPRIPAEGRRGRRWILVDEWGPYDYRSPKLWPSASPDTVPLELRVLGPPGSWRLVEARGGARVEPGHGAVPGTLAVTPPAGPAADWAIALEYRGADVVTAFGDSIPAGEPIRFGWERFFAPVDWRIRVHAWEDATDPRSSPAAFRELLDRGAPLLEQEADRIEWLWFRPRIEDIPSERWALRAEGTVELPPGEYRLRTSSDDGVRVWVDGRLAIDAWDPHESRIDEARIPGGSHELALEYYQVDGWVELTVGIRPGGAR